MIFYTRSTMVSILSVEKRQSNFEIWWATAIKKIANIKFLPREQINIENASQTAVE